jgi:hypothetical protein
MLVTYIDHLQKQNADDLAFYPLSTLEKAIEQRRIITTEDNGEPAGYIWHGPIRSGFDTIIYQACVDYDSRRRHLGWEMVNRLLNISMSATGIRLRCASSSDANAFWRLIGFYCTNVTTGGVKRQRDINYWRTDIQPTLFTLPSVQPSDEAIDESSWRRMRRDGLVMPSRWSRGHYGSLKVLEQE